MRFTIYDAATGEIKKLLEAPEFLLEANTPDGCSAIIDGFDNSTYRIDLTATPHEAIMKTDVPNSLDFSTISADGVDMATLSSLPDGTAAWLDGELYEPTAGEISIIADLPGTYRIELRHPLYLPTFVEVIAT